MRIFREMSRNPVDDDADPVLVATIDKMPELIRVPKSAGGSVVAGYLIAPGPIEGMLGHRHQFEVCVTQVLHIRDQTICELDIAEIPVPFFRDAGPRSEVNLIDADRLFVPLLRFPGLDPFVIAPFETVEVKHQGSGLDSMLPVETERITFQYQLAKGISHLKLVMGPFSHAWDEDFPNSGFDPFSHRMTSAIPAVEIAYDADTLRIGTPDGKGCAWMSVDLGQVSAEFLVDVIVVALLKKVHVKFTKNRTIGIRVTKLESLSGPGSDLQQIVERFFYANQRRFEQALVGDAVRWKMTFCVMPVDYG